MYFASKSTGGFYCSDVHGERIPADAIVISKELYYELVLNKPSGKVIDWTCELPALADKNARGEDEMAASARAERNMLLAASDWTQVADAPADAAAWRAYRQALRDITEQAGFPSMIDWPVAPL